MAIQSKNAMPAAKAADAEANLSKPDLSIIQLGIVCPMANESATAAHFVDAVLSQTRDFASVLFFAVLDRASSDGTRGLLSGLSEREPRLRVVWAPENRCAVDAYVRGYREALAAGSDWILEIDAGYSHSPGDIPQFWGAMSRGYDCVFGTRFSMGGRIVDSSGMRYWVSKGGTVLSNLLLGTKLGDMTSGFELFTRESLRMVLDRGIQSRAHFFQTEIKAYCRNLRIAEVPITYRSASPGLSGAAIRDAFTQLWRLFKLRIRGQL